MFPCHPALRIRIADQTVWLNDNELHLSPREYELLLYLIRHGGLALERAQIIDDVWGGATDAHSRVLDTYIKQLRHKLSVLGKPIHTISKFGYRFDLAPEQIAVE